MIIERFQEQFVTLSMEERLELARWLIDTALFSQKRSSTEIEQSLSSPDSSDDILEQEIVAFRTMHLNLFEQIPEQYAAIHEGQLIDYDHDQAALYIRIREQYRDVPILIRQVLPKPDREIIVRSPRFEYV